MPYDVEFTAGINDASASRSLAGMSRQAKELSRTLATEVGGSRLGGVLSRFAGMSRGALAVALPVAAVTGLLNGAKQYAKYNDDAADAMLKQQQTLERTARISHNMWGPWATGAQRVKNYLIKGTSDVLDVLATPLHAVNRHILVGKEEMDRQAAKFERNRDMQRGLAASQIGGPATSSILRNVGRPDQAGMVNAYMRRVQADDEIRRQYQGNTIDKKRAKLLYGLSSEQFRTDLIAAGNSRYSGITGGPTEEIVNQVAGPRGNINALPQRPDGPAGEMVSLLQELVRQGEERQRDVLRE